jgi:ABC-type dipeptide/oligopeptide/nickel transport system permease component
MTRFVVRRVLWSIPVLLAIVLFVFLLMRALPGGPFDFAGDKSLPPYVVANLQARYHLDEPLWMQFVRYLAGDFVDTLNPMDLGSNGLLRGDLGLAFRQRGRTVNDIVGESLPISAQLGILAVLLAVGVGIPLGTLAALKQNTWIDYASTFIAILGVSVPPLVAGPVLQWIFSLKLDWFPISTWGAAPPFVLGFLPIPNLNFWSHAALPALALGSRFSAQIARLTRASILQVIREDYIRTARAKGLRQRAVVIKHVLKNSLIPVVTILGPLFVGVVTGTFVIEQIFGIPGMGRHFVDSIGNRDYSMIQGVTIIYAVLLVIANLIVDISYAWIDPRIRYE